MANNRMWLTCQYCISKGEDWRATRILLFKYYPSSNWYFFTMAGGAPRREEEINAFMDLHEHPESCDINLGPEHFKIRCTPRDHFEVEYE